jgi:hypothetical protein
MYRDKQIADAQAGIDSISATGVDGAMELLKTLNTSEHKNLGLCRTIEKFA